MCMRWMWRRVFGAPRPCLLIPLNYGSGCTDIYTGYNTTCGKLGKKGSVADWRPWGDSFQQIINDGFPAGRAIDLEVTGDLFTSYPQAMLADIEFTPNGDMMVGFRDRFSDQIGYLDPGPEQQHPFGVDVIAVGAGDVLRGSPKGDGTFSLENNSQSVPAGRFGPSLGQNNQQGPGGGEFYFGDDERAQDPRRIQLWRIGPDARRTRSALKHRRPDRRLLGGCHLAEPCEWRPEPRLPGIWL